MILVGLEGADDGLTEDGVGMGVDIVGSDVGETLDFDVGSGDGAEVGTIEFSEDGLADGFAVGVTEGDPVGKADGCDVTYQVIRVTPDLVPLSM